MARKVMVMSGSLFVRKSFVNVGFWAMRGEGRILTFSCMCRCYSEGAIVPTSRKKCVDRTEGRQYE